MSDIKTFKDLYEFLTTLDDENIIEWLKDPWVGKDKQESLLRLFAKLGLIDKLRSYNFCVGNFNKKTYKKITNIDEILNLNLKDNGDSSDLTCINKNDDNSILLITSKNLNNYKIGNLDIEKIIKHFETKKYIILDIV